MLAEGDKTAREEIEETYEPPALVSLGSVEELTASFPDQDGSLTPSDRALKQEIEPLENALERLRALRTR